MCLPEQNTTHWDLMFSRQATKNRSLPQRIVTNTFAFAFAFAFAVAVALLCTGLCVLLGYAGSCGLSHG